MKRRPTARKNGAPSGEARGSAVGLEQRCLLCRRGTVVRGGRRSPTTREIELNTRRRLILLAVASLAVGLLAVSPGFGHALKTVKGTCTMQGMMPTPATDGNLSVEMSGTGKHLQCSATLTGTWKAESSANKAIFRHFMPAYGRNGAFSQTLSAGPFTGQISGSMTVTGVSTQPALKPVEPPVPPDCFWLWHLFPNVGPPPGQWGWQLVCKFSDPASWNPS